MPHATLPSPGLQALILCGPGVSLNTFTSTPRDFPKALVPIANRPMVWYPLDWCHRMGISDITLITPPESRDPIEHALKTHPALTVGLKSRERADVVAPADLTQTTGTGELLRLPEVQKLVKGDFVVLPCDLISELDGSVMVQQWQTLNPPTTNVGGKKKDGSSGTRREKGGMGVFYPTQGLEGISTKKDETDFLATVAVEAPTVPAPTGSVRENVEEVVMCMPTDTLNDKLEEDKGVLRVRQRLIERFGKVKMRMKYRDAHVYIFPKWIMDFAAKNERFDSISEDVLGWWAKSRWQESLIPKLGLDEVLAPHQPSSDEMDDDEEEDEIDAVTLSSTKSTVPPPSSTPQQPSFATRVRPSPTQPQPPSHPSIPPILAYIHPTPTTPTPHPTTQPLIRRCDTTPHLHALSLYLARQQPLTAPAADTPPHPFAADHKIHPTASIGAQSRISAEDCLIAENVRVGGRCNFRETVVGANCEIGSMVRLTRCVLMEGCVIGDGVVMSGCVVGRRARVEGMNLSGGAGGEGQQQQQQQQGDMAAGEKKAGKAGGKKKGGEGDGEDGKTRLTDCEIAPNFVVEAGTEAKGEKLMAFDTDDLSQEDEDEGEGEEAGEGSEMEM
ncbi:hypothetical protein D0862_02777 [Hortaea werneckii]|uniref:Mannose-1-phosphate guanyltransferase n=1 Tax=Hortaea werneckii TaxID=91943 RepID=A0A3M7HFM6_HORWE|nr:hypothetical protein D0862_02777 [Hortaea werneckii]